MASELPASTSPASNRNPFRRSQAEPSLTYSIEGRKVHISPHQYRTLQKFFTKHTRDREFIQDELVVEILQLSKSTEEELADLWEDALRATFSSAVTTETRLGFLNKDEFFVLLSELQAKMGMSDESFSNTFLDRDVPAQARRNPFKRRTSVEDSTPLDESPESPLKPVEMVGREDTNRPEEFENPVKEGIDSTDETPVSPETLSPAADGSTSALGTPDPAISPLSPNTPASLPLLPTISMTVAKDDKEVVHPSRPLKSSDQNYPPLEPVQRKALPSSAGTGSGEIEVVGRTISEKEVRPSSALDIRSSKQVDDRSQNPHTDETQRQLVLHSSSLTSPPFNAASHNVVEAEAPIYTSASDDLALERLTTLRAREPLLPPRPEKKQSFSRRLLTKAHLSKSKQGPISMESATIGRRFSLRFLSQVLQDAATEGNLPLVASLFKLGADVNFSSLDPPKHHHILGVAAVLGQTHIVDYFTLMGADETSIHQAFASAFNNGHMEMAIRLVPHINMYSLKLFVNSSTDVNILISLLGQVARNVTVSANNRERMLETMIDQKQFSSTEVVYEIRDKKSPSEVRDKKAQSEAPKVTNDLRASYNITQLLISSLDVELVDKILTKVGNTPPERTFHGWVITAEEWQKNPRRALEMLQLLITESAPIDNETKSQERMEMTPLAHAVAGGNLEAVRLLLELNADPECLIYEAPQDGKLSTDAYTALGWAARQGRVDLCRRLVGAGAIPWRTGAFNQAPLYWASRHGHSEVVEYLLSLDTKRSSIHGCLIAAIEGNEPEIAKLMLDSGATISPDTWEATMRCQPKPRDRSKHLEIIDFLLSKQSKRIHAEAIACAIKSKNFAGLSRVLENWDNDSSFGSLTSHYIYRGPAKNRIYTCVQYAEHKGALDFVSLLKNYRWTTGQTYEGL